MNTEQVGNVDNVMILHATVVNSYQFTPSGETCAGDRSVTTTCCDTLSLDEGDQFEIPSTAFAYGVEEDTTSDIQLLAFSSSSSLSTYQVEGFGIFPMGDEFDLQPGTALTSGLALLRFLIGGSFIAAIDAYQWFLACISCCMQYAAVDINS